MVERVRRGVNTSWVSTLPGLTFLAHLFLIWCHKIGILVIPIYLFILSH